MRKVIVFLSLLVIAILLSTAGTTPALKAQADNTVSLLTYGDAGKGGDDTAVFQAALDAVAGNDVTLLVPVPVSSPYLVRPLYIRSDTSIELESGVIIQATPGYGLLDRLLTVRDVTNVTINGYGATLQMPKAEYTSGEERHALAILGSSNVTVKGLACNDSGGDGIYIAGDETLDLSYSENVLIQDVTCNNNRRQGMSIIAAQNLLVSHSRFTNTNGTLPQNGIDIEPGYPGRRLVNVRIENCVTADNAGDGITVNLSTLDSTGPPVGITISNHLDQRAHDFGIIVLGTNKISPVTGTVSIENFTSEFAGLTGVDVRDWSATGATVTFTNLTIIDPLQGHIGGWDSAISISQSANDPLPGGNIFIPSSTISDSTGYLKYYFKVSDPTTLDYQHLQIAHGNWSGALNDPYGLYLGRQVTSIETDPIITKTVDKPSASSGDVVTYTITYSNPSSITFSNVKIADPIPTGTVFDGIVSGGATFDGTNVVLDTGNLAPNTNGSISFKVRVQ